MYRIAVMGDRDSIYGFSALGLDIICVENDDTEAGKKLRRLAEGEYAVIYITELLAQKLEKEIDKYANCELPAIILIPGITGNTGAGVTSVKKSVEKAVGSDILFNG